MTRLFRIVSASLFSLQGCGGLDPSPPHSEKPPSCEQLADELNEHGQALAQITGAKNISLNHPDFIQICANLPADTRRCIRPSYQFANFERCTKQWETIPKSDRKRLKKLTNLGQTP